MSRYDVANKTVFITGAARGIGAETARRLHAKGAKVALVGLEPALLENLAKELGERAVWFEADVTDSDALEAAAAGTVEAFGSIDVALANAGLSFIGTVQDQPVEHWVRTIDVNLIGVYRTNRAVLPHIVASGGYILNVASLSAIAHAPLMSAYTASKAAVEAMTDALRVELAPTRATAGTAYFGFVDTDLVRGAYEHPATKALNRVQPGFLKTPIPLPEAIDAIERGIAGRKARTWAPWTVGPMLIIRGIMPAIIERAMLSKLSDLKEALAAAHPSNAAAPPVDAKLGVAIQDGEAALSHGSARDLV